MGKGIITSIFDWLKHPFNSDDQNPTDWILGLILILCVSFAWTRVVKKIVE